MAASASSFDKPTSRHLVRGQSTEDDAIRWLTRQGFQILERRLKTPFAEVDILAQRPNREIVIFEVKSSLWPDGEGMGLSRRQKMRLFRASLWLAEKRGVDVEVCLLSPSTRGEISSGSFDEIPIF